jgi:hypothetical protein
MLALAQSCSRVSHVLLGLRTHLHHLAGANVALPSLAAGHSLGLFFPPLFFLFFFSPLD